MANLGKTENAVKWTRTFFSLWQCLLDTNIWIDNANVIADSFQMIPIVDSRQMNMIDELDWVAI